MQETGRALKVHTDTPHLVSLGGGRLSTAVTLHPLPEGRTTIGSGQGVDIVVQGTGVEPTHCHIDNKDGVVTLVPVAEMTSVDGVYLTQPTRLTQGCMVCIGRSNYLRFNHPAEARLMKSVLPNPRISMLPITFHPGEDCIFGSGIDGKPPPAPRRSGGSRDSWGELSSASSDDLAARIEMSRFISPKVFPPGSSTVNSPASVVLGPRSTTPYRQIQYNRSSDNMKNSSPYGMENYDSRIVYNPTGRLVNGNALVNGNVYQNVSQFAPVPPRVDSPQSTQSPSSVNSSRVNSVSSQSPSEHAPSPSSGKPSPSRVLSIPSPAFDRNPSYNARKSVTSPTSSWDSSIEDLTARKGELENKRKQAENERLVEQENERLERLRLEEILTMCADYEKQAQWERTTKPQQNRIKTNGSLPRDKRLPSPSSPQRHQGFIYENDMSPNGLENRHTDTESKYHMLGESVMKSSVNYENVPLVHPNSPRTRIKTILPNKDLNSREYNLEVIENKLAILNDYEILGPPPPPRNSSKHVIGPASVNNASVQTKVNGYCSSSSGEDSVDQRHKDNQNQNHVNTNKNDTNYNGSRCKPSSIAEANAISKYEFFGFDPRNSGEFSDTPSYQNVNKFSSLKKSNESLPPNKMKASKEEGTSSPITKTNSVFGSDPSWSNPTVDLIKLNGEYTRKSPVKNGEYTTEQLMSQLEAIVRGSPHISPVKENEREIIVASPGVNDRNSGKFILPLPDPPTQMEMQSNLRMERTQLVANLTTLKAKVMEIEQQEEELMRELEIERALVGGELQAQNEKLTQEENRVKALRERLHDCEKEMEKCVSQQQERQQQSKHRLDQHQAVLHTLDQQLAACAEDSELRPELVESLKQQQELLEAEKKSFEDLEFNLLEEEACWLSRKEELQREVSEAAARCKDRQEKLAHLQAQREEAVKIASSNTKQLEVQLVDLLRRIEEGRSRLSEIDSQLQNGIKASTIVRDVDRKQSQDDLERISRVTSGAPMEVSTNSLGRRTIASLQEIERNRQLHLAKQGSLVIEEERKRVSELKRRVQDEARAEWEERRQRENNCNSLNSVGSEESSLTSSDLHTESASSEDAEKRLTATTNESTKPNSVQSEQIDKEDAVRQMSRDKEERQPDSRPLSDASTYSEDQLTVRMRNKSASNLQRPLTRYLPIRGEALDLRQHIESAGHQVDLCPHVIIDKTSCRGYLHKMTSRFHQWNKRWFVFDRTRRTLTYYSDRSEKKARGGAYFQAIEEVYVDHLNCVKSPNPQVTFVIKSSERTYYLVAPSSEAMRIWVDVIFTGAEGYQEFSHGS